MPRRPLPLLRHILRRTVLAIVLLLALTALGITIDGLTNTRDRSDFGLVLGNKVHPDGTLSVALRSRVDQAAALYRSGLVGHLLVSGALGGGRGMTKPWPCGTLWWRWIPDPAISVDSQVWDTA